jgi:hypothetical protein
VGPAGGHRADPGAGVATIAALAALLDETAEHHDPYEQMSPPHDWWDWYAAYMDAWQTGSSSREASVAAGRYMAEVKLVVGSPS